MKTVLLCSSATLFFASLVFANGTVPLLEYTFNTPQYRYDAGVNIGSGALSTGQSAMKVGFRNGLGGGPPRGAGQAWYTANKNFYTSDGGGVSGFFGDFAVQIDTVAGDMGDLDGNATNSQGAAIAESADPMLVGLEQLTITGWYYVRGNEPLRNYARLVSNHAGGSGFELRNTGDIPGRLELRLNEGTVFAPGDPFTEVGKWVFFAVTYDAASAGTEVQFYKADRTTDVAPIGTALAMAQGLVGAGTNFTLGNAPGNGLRSFSGHLDNIRVYGVALTLSELQQVRSGDLDEPVNFPLPPSGLTATVQSATEVYLEWVDNSDNEEFFNLVRTDSTGSETIQLAADTVDYLDTGLDPDTQYTYTIVSGIAEGNYPPTESVTVTTASDVTFLEAVSNIRVIGKSATGATIAWQDNAVGEAGYIVELFNEGSQSWEAAAVLPANAEQVVFSQLSASGLVRVRVYAYNAGIESEPVEIVFELRDRELGIGGIQVYEIDESEVTRIIHVDPVNGNDANDGSTLGNAKRTISSAFQLAGTYNNGGEGTRILLQPGIYQEGSPDDDLFTQSMIGIGGGIWGNPGKPIILEGAGWNQNRATGDVVISGSNRYTNWTHIGNNVYEHSWTIDWPMTDSYPFPGSPIGTRTYHGVNVRPDGERYWQMYYHMAGPDDPNIANIEPDEGYFWVDQDADYIRVKAPAGVDLTDPTLEVNVNERHRLFQYFQATGSSSTNPITPFVMRNLVFQHGYRGPFLQNVGGAIVEDCSFENTKLFGFSYDGSFPGFVLRRCDFIRNGHSGGGVDGIEDGQSDYLFEDLFFLENGRQAVVTAFRGHFESQIKLADMNGATFRDFHMVGAQGVGLWLDTGLRNFETYNGIIEGGITAHMFIENHNRNNIENLGNQLTVYARDIWIRDGVFDKTQNQDNTKGVQTAESENWVVDNLWIEGQARPYNFAYNNRGDIYENTIKNTVVVQDQALEFYFGETETWQQAFDTFIPEFGGNRYYGGTELGFLGRNREALSFADWVFEVNNNPTRLVSGIEAGSLRFADPGAARPTLGIYPTDREMTEGESLAKGLLVTRQGASIESALVVDLDYTAGTGSTSTDDFVSLPAQVTIPAGAMSVYVPISIREDGLEEGLELFEVQVLAQGDYEVLAEPARINVIDADTSDLPLFKLQPLGDRLYENVDEVLQVRILREGQLTNPVTLELVDVGGATLGIDYSISSTTLTFGIDDYEQIIGIQPVGDSELEGVERVELALTQTTSEAIVISAPGKIVLPLNDNDGVIDERLLVETGPGFGDLSGSTFTIANPGDTAMDYSFAWPVFSLEDIGSERVGGPSPGNFIDISATGKKLSWNWFFPNDDGFSEPIELPWAFSWYGEAYTSLRANSNGFIVFGNPANLFARYADPTLLPLNTSATSGNCLAIAWANLRLDSSSGLYSELVDGKFIIQWDEFLVQGNRATFQLQFEEGSVATVYYSVWPNGQDIMVGYQDSTKEQGGTIIPRAALPGTPYAIRLQANIPFINSDTTSVRVGPGESKLVTVDIDASGLSLGANATQLAISASLGADFDQRLPVFVQYGDPDILAIFGEDILGTTGNSIEHTRMGWLDVGSWPYADSQDLGWLYYGGSTPAESFWHAFDWDSGWLYMDPSWYPYVYMYNNGHVANKWVYLVPAGDAIWGYVIGGDWVSFPRN